MTVAARTVGLSLPPGPVRADVRNGTLAPAPARQYGARRDLRRSPFAARRARRRAGQPDRRPGPAPGLLPELLDGLAASGRPVRLLRAGSAAEAEATCRTAVAEGAAALVAVGGDGTVHRAMQAVAGTSVPFGPVPAGTGNDFAMETGFPADPRAAVDVIATALREDAAAPSTWPG
ncbi:hypothetical protein GCM10029963_06850 [Micromonospora andamanensis]